MAKNKSAATPHYELLYIIANKFSENELEPIIAKVTKLIDDAQGTITHTEDWGKKKMAYQIAGYSHGYYRLVEFDLEPASLARIERNIRMMPEIIRHQVVSKAPFDPTQVKPASIKPVVEKIEPIVIKNNETPKVKDKADLKDLDEKLDKILETNDLL